MKTLAQNAKTASRSLSAMTTEAKNHALLTMADALGVMAIIYESRPNVTAEVIALCVKSSNAVILRGGKMHFNWWRRQSAKPYVSWFSLKA